MRLVRRLTLWLLLVVGLVFTADTYLSIQQHLDLFDTDLRRDQQQIGRALAQAVERAWRDGGQDAALELVRGAGDPESSVRIRLVSLVDASGTPLGPDVPSEALEANVRARSVTHVRDSRDGQRLYTYVPLSVAGDPVVALELSESIADQKTYLTGQIRKRLGTAAILFGTCALVAWVVGARIVGRPIQRLVDQAQRIGSGDFESRLELAQRDELSLLADEINAMAASLAAGARNLAEQSAARIAALEQLHHAERLSTVGKLASGLAHELGTPLNVISGRARMIADGELEGPEEPATTARIIVDQAERMTRIVRQLLDFARLRIAEKHDTNLTQLARQVVELLDPLAAQTQVGLRCASGETPVHASVDASQIQQAVTNLVMNAIRASRRGGQVSVSVRDAARAVYAGGAARPHAVIEVSDSGIGIPPEHLPAIFDPFYTTKPVGEGTGLGLSVAHGIVDEHHGRIEVVSAPDRGSVFQIWLPCEAS